MPRKTERPAAGKRALRRCLAPGLVEPTEAQRAFAEARRDDEARLVAIRRRLMEVLGVPKVCARKACRRANACRGPGPECYEVARPILQRHLFPGLRKALKARESGYAQAGSEEAES